MVALEAVVCHTVDPLAQAALLANVDCNESGSRLLQHHQLWVLTETPLRYSAIASSPGDPVATVWQDRPFKVLQQLVGGVDARVVPLKALDLGLGGS